MTTTPKKSETPMYVAAIALWLLSLITLVFAAFSLFDFWKYKNEGVLVTANIINTRQEEERKIRSSNNGKLRRTTSTSYLAYVSFTVAKTSVISFADLSISHTEFEKLTPNDTIEVYYLSSDPKTAITKSSMTNKPYSIMYTIITSFAMLAGGTILWFWDHRRQLG